MAVDQLRQNGIEGPYALAIDTARYTAIVSTTEHGGYPLMDHLAGSSIGYHHHDAEQVHLYLEESFTFKVAEPDAAVALT